MSRLNPTKSKETPDPGQGIPGRDWSFIKNTLIFALFALSVTLTYLLYRQTHSVKVKVDSGSLSDISGAFSMIRSHNSKLTAPLLLANVNVESQKMTALKADLDMAIRQWENNGHVQSVSIYLRELNNGNWININGNEQFLPGSLLKVPILITWLKKEMEHPGTINQEFLFEKPGQNLPEQAYKESSIIPGKKYKVSALLKYMIRDSDNNATFVLIRNLDNDGFRKLFYSLGLPPADLSDIGYTISARDYSRFLGVLYNATYLNEGLSEYALELLSQSKFQEGLVKKLPKGVNVAHKFGEHTLEKSSEFSEAGIVYRDNEPYILTIMTKGDDIKQQTEAISDLSSMVYQRFPH